MSAKHRREKDKTEKTDRSPRVPQRDKIGFLLNIKERDDLTDKQKELIDLILNKNTKIVFLSGPAGTSKTFISVLAGLKLMNNKSVSDIMYIRSLAQSASKDSGALPGEARDKFQPFYAPLSDKLEELLDKADVNRLVKEERVSGTAVNFIRGTSLNAKFIFADESQNFDVKELTTIITRIGKYSKLIIAADPNQSDINGKSGFIKFFDLFNDESSRKEGIHCFAFTKDDVVRSGVLKYILEKIENSGNALK